jgi:hypothetical protein
MPDERPAAGLKNPVDAARLCSEIQVGRGEHENLSPIQHVCAVFHRGIVVSDFGLFGVQIVFSYR